MGWLWVMMILRLKDFFSHFTIKYFLFQYVCGSALISESSLCKWCSSKNVLELYSHLGDISSLPLRKHLQLGKKSSNLAILKGPQYCDQQSLWVPRYLWCFWEKASWLLCTLGGVKQRHICSPGYLAAEVKIFFLWSVGFNWH